MSYPYRGPPMGRGAPMGYGHPHQDPYYAPPHADHHDPGAPHHGYYEPSPPPPHGMRTAPPGPRAMLQSETPPSGMGREREYPVNVPLQHGGTPSPRVIGRGHSSSAGTGTPSASDTDIGGYGSGNDAAPTSKKPADREGFASDCEIVVINKPLNLRYAEYVERELRKQTGLVIDLMFPKGDMKLQEFLKPVARMGAIFAIIIDADGERDKSINFYQFRGVPKPTYHKNVPLKKAFEVINNIYTKLKDKEVGVTPDDMKTLMGRLINDVELSGTEYGDLLRFLHERKRKVYAFTHRSNNNAVQELPSDVDSLVESPAGKELQKRILALLNEK